MKSRTAKVLGVAVIAVIAATAIAMVKEKSSELEATPFTTTTATEITATATAETTATTITTATTTTTTTLEVRKYLPEYTRSSYCKGKVLTTSIVVKDQNGNISDYIKEGETFYYLDVENYGNMVHIFYERANAVCDGWIPEREDWWN
ncbi:MAG: hypothetical protein J6J36_05535 [Clostridia bacterium]|nr:hypothetical protein [Clostridia bacterium]